MLHGAKFLLFTFFFFFFLRNLFTSTLLCVTCLPLCLPAHSSSAGEDDQYFNEVSFQLQACLFPLSTSRIFDELPLAVPSLQTHVHTFTNVNTCLDRLSAMQPALLLPPQLRYLCQQTAPHSSPALWSSFPSEPCSFIHQRCPQTLSKIPLCRKACIPLYACLSCW